MTTSKKPVIPKLSAADYQLLNAAHNGDVDGILKALSEGANINATNEIGDSALHIAARGNHGGERYYKGKQAGSSLIDVKRANHSQSFITLLEAGADASLPNHGQFTPLHITSMLNLAPETLALLIVGARRDLRDSHGTLPEDYTAYLPDQTLGTYYALAQQHPAYLPVELEHYGANAEGINGLRIDLAKREAALDALAIKNGTPRTSASSPTLQGTVNLGEAIAKAQRR